jgi:hypothetical protein
MWPCATAPSGFLVFFSVIDDDWPGVKARLEALLAP